MFSDKNLSLFQILTQTRKESPFSAALSFVGARKQLKAGKSLIDSGIPLAVIGKKRLNWVVDDYNQHRGFTHRIGATPNGVGLAINF